MSAAAWRHVWRLIGLGAGVAMLAWALAMAMRLVDLRPLGQAQAGELTVLAIAVGANLFLSGLLFWAITLAFDAQPPVRLTRMTQLLCASWLINYLPFHPGWIGRAAYLKRRHDLPLAQSAVISAIGFSCGVVVVATAAAITWIQPVWGQPLIGAVVLIGASSLTGRLAQRLIRRDIVYSWTWLPIRVMLLLAKSLRLWIAFSMVGYPIPFHQAVTVSAIGLLVDLLGITPNGLGFCEWVVGGMTQAMTAVEGSAGLAAALIDRAVEALIVAIVGLLSVWQLKRR